MDIIIELCHLSSQTGYSYLQHKYRDVVYCIIVIPEQSLTQEQCLYYKIGMREFVCNDEDCYALIFCKANRQGGYLKIASSYIVLRGDIFIGRENLLGEDCYWSKSEIESHILPYCGDREKYLDKIRKKKNSSGV